MSQIYDRSIINQVVVLAPVYPVVIVNLQSNFQKEQQKFDYLTGLEICSFKLFNFLHWYQPKFPVKWDSQYTKLSRLPDILKFELSLFSLWCFGLINGSFYLYFVFGSQPISQISKLILLLVAFATCLIPMMAPIALSQTLLTFFNRSLYKAYELDMSKFLL